MSMIGIFDSGVGGLSVYRELKKILPHTSYIYLADQNNAPYGIKNGSKIRELTIKALRFLKKKKPNVIVIACNSATVSGLSYYRETIDIPIIGLVPAIKPAAKNCKSIAILTTEVTSKSKQLNNYINTFAYNKTTHVISNTRLVEFVENGDLNSYEYKKEINSVVNKLKTLSVDALVLGCTHFVFCAHDFKKHLPDLNIYDSTEGVSEQTKRIYKSMNIQNNNSKDTFITTGNVDQFSSNLYTLLGLKVDPKKVNLV